VTLWCAVDGKVRQNGSTQDMIFAIPRLISHVSQFMRLEPGDILLTGALPR
jgi:2-keto-4-pentenoate hydratase/2-oxohepta-3-ene-1,7-dioic acid hydratase in catechol pathway